MKNCKKCGELIKDSYNKHRNYHYSCKKQHQTTMEKLKLAIRKIKGIEK